MTDKDIYQEVTDFIIEELENPNLRNSESPFACISRSFPENPVTDNQYNGINVLILAFTTQKKEFTSNKWATYKQWSELGGNVKKGEKGTTILFYKPLEIKSESSDETSFIPMAKRYTVFNENQIENYISTKNPLVFGEVNYSEQIEIFVSNTKANFNLNGQRACYYPLKDIIEMPSKDKFFENNTSATDNYYSTLLHELTHWSGHESRLNRKDIYPDNKKQSYAFEELIAELGSAFLSADFNLNVFTRQDHVLYIKSWLKALKDDKKFIFKASTQANKAVQFLKEKQPS